ncbi:ABC transporter permease [Collinsella sp. zg1085]|uniref:ABC transporter permease n=1 Tax=Collinsella sp. zg1085 TaxID=2844380 RepID=UPI001C0DA140|nr:ABC transporter permease [Collinsella sp. zg1085]QWT17159.1 ABC transporter permease [Collinsella sp. zg1085]
MHIRDLIREAFRALEANRVRSFLTILGIVIGIAAVISMTSLIGGIQDNLIGSLGLNAARTIEISSWGFTTKQLERLQKVLPGYELLEGTSSGWTETKIDNKQANANITGLSPKMLELSGKTKLIAGRYFNDAENNSSARVVILDPHAVQLLFKTENLNVIGKTARIGTRNYTVVGIEEGRPMGRGGGDREFFWATMPFNTVVQDFNGGDKRLDGITGIAREGVDVDELSAKTKEEMAKILKITDKEQIDDRIYIHTMKSVIDSMNKFMGSFSLIMSSVAGISLLVGGIGIMNMMLTNVTERIREIGVRRALGATRRDVTLQFLTESAVLCVTGGILGIVIGYLISWGLAAGASVLGLASSTGVEEGSAIIPSMSIMTICIAVGISIAIGVIFGYYPARRAAKLDPVECLRYQ